MTHPLLVKVIVVAIIIWWLSSDAPAARVSKQLEVDDDVYSPTFGYPVVPADTRAPASSSAAVQDAIDMSSAAINEYVVPSNPWGIT